MKNLSAVLGIVIALAVPCTADAAARLPGAPYLVQFADGVPPDAVEMIGAAGGRLHRLLPEIDAAVAVSADPGFARRLARLPAVRQVTPDVLVQWTPPPSPAPAALTTAAGSGGLAAAGAPTSAEFYACQWYLGRIGAADAWARGAGGAGVKVAVLDSGIDAGHLDLWNQVDLARSVSVLSSSPCGAADTGTIEDLDSHGTFVASLIAARGFGMAGLAPEAELVAVKVLDCTGAGSFGDLIAGVLYAAGLPDVQVVNMSLAASVPRDMPGAGPLLAALGRAVNHAAASGKLVVSAAGNAEPAGRDLDLDGNLVEVPAQTGRGLGIYATTIADGLATYSNHGISGSWVGAPGGSRPYFGTALPGCVVPRMLQGMMFGACASSVCGGWNWYVVSSGTSSSTALVSGTAALVLGRAGGAIGPGQLKGILAVSAEDLGEEGTDSLFSHGRVDAGRAVDARP